jgi:hypothetical protein
MNSVEPLVFLAGVSKLGVDSGDWKLVDAGSQGEDRVYRATVTFERAFRALPIVHIGLVGFDISNQDAARLKLAAECITTEGFDVVVRTWLGTQIWSVEASWLAVGA